MRPGFAPSQTLHWWHNVHTDAAQGAIQDRGVCTGLIVLQTAAALAFTVLIVLKTGAVPALIVIIVGKGRERPEMTIFVACLIV